MDDLNRRLEVAKTAAARAGEIQKQHFGDSLKVDKTSEHDLKIEVDRLCEAAIRDCIRETFPKDGFLGEECGELDGETEYRWIADPLDGTVNFFHGLPHYCACVSCYQKSGFASDTACPRPLSSLGKPLVGVVHAQATGDVYAAITGQGATCNGESIRVRAIEKLDEAITAFTYGSSEEAIEKMLRIAGQLVRRCRKVRTLGATGLDLCHVAAGNLDALIQERLGAWDFAAARVILEEAGGFVDATEYRPGRWRILACTPAIAADLREIVAA